MARRVVAKIQVTYVLEAVKESLKHLGNWSAGDLRDASPSREVVQQDSLLRRLREYLTRCIESYRTPIQWELSEDDENLVVSCIVHSVPALDRRIADKLLDPEVRTWLVEKRDGLLKLARSMQTRPLERIAHRTPKEMETENVLPFLHRDFPPRPPPRRAAPGAAAPAAAPEPPPLPDESPAGVYGFESTPVEPPTKISGVYRGVAPSPEPAPREPAAAQVEAPETGGDWEALDLSRIKHPRLRSLIGLDISAFRRAERVSDHRLEIIHLASVLEGVVLDARSRSRRVGSVDAPDVLDDLETVLARPLDTGQAVMLAQLKAARNLLRPAIMLASPIVVTHEGIRQLRAFVDKILLDLGYIGAVGNAR